MTGASSESATATGGATTTRAAVRVLVRSRLGIDPRALAAFRIGLGLVVVLDLIVLRAPGLVTFYTDAGILPRSTLDELSPTLARWSLYALSGSVWVQALLLAVTGALTVCVLLGYRHRLAAIGSALLLTSLHARNPYLVNGGDTILISLLLFAAVLPLDARWAIRPRQRDSRDGQRVVSTATALLLLHVVVIYAINAVLKFRSEEWLSGIAVQRIFRLESFTGYLGPTIADYPALLTAINWLWVAVLSASVLLVLATGRLRTATVAAYVGAHLSMAATMRLGMFPLIMVTVLVVFLPPPVWDRLEHLGSATGLARRLGALRPRGERTEAGSMSRSVLSPRVRRGTRLAAAALLVCVFLAAASWQVTAAGLVDNPSAGGDSVLEHSSWAFFAPNPPDTYSWYVVEATDAAGESTDLLRGGPATFDGPPDVAARYSSTLWERYGRKGQGAGEPAREAAGSYFCAQAPDGVESVTIYRVDQSVDANGPVGEPTPHELIVSRC
ncbi:HTTM domain-containing protein [Natrinema pallidum]|uniref:HTTM domain protein n=1 Tax=Natrinema pallidum DSM 3751 TaxID=1227495 RepID=L9Z1A8_9EURY|nr:HTTM domain-containing protein [Natrinema pallidum]ELY80295.1 HTTM domain protein [Natrinema pallidum DSM 3751]